MQHRAREAANADPPPPPPPPRDPRLQSVSGINALVAERLSLPPTDNAISITVVKPNGLSVYASLAEMFEVKKLPYGTTTELKGYGIFKDGKGQSYVRLEEGFGRVKDKATGEGEKKKVRICEEPSDEAK